MTKSLNNEIMAILRQYEVAGELSSRRSISGAAELSLGTPGRALRFRFERTDYYVIYDETADDDEEYLAELVRLDNPQAKVSAVRNPHDDQRTHGLRFKGKEIYLLEVVPEKRRLDHELARRYPQFSRSTLQKYIKGGYVTVGSTPITQPGTEVRDTDDIALTPPAKHDFSARELPIIYIDDDIIVVDKPAGVLTHAKGALNDEFTVAEFFRRYTTNALETNRPGIVHRLDRATSGVMVGARHDEAATALKRQFADRKVKKTYIAVTEGVPKILNAVIDLPIGRNPSAPSMFRVDPGGKPAQTTYEVLASTARLALVKLLPKTGRTHQLRVHLQYLNTPILGDPVYGKRQKEDRLYLHARAIELTMMSGERREFTSVLPDEFVRHFPGVSYE